MWFMAGLHTCSIFYYLRNICADLCQSALLPQLDLFFRICVALVLYSHIFICHWCISCRKWQHLMETSWKLNDSNQRAPPETKCATSFWWEHDLNHYSYTTSVETKLGIETSNYSGCHFWKTAWWHLLTVLVAIQWWNCYCN